MKEEKYCRCCLSEDCEKDMINEYFFDESSEVYSRMLAETFDIIISQHTGSKCLICQACISRLRDAAAFKKQVLATEQNLLKLAALMDGNMDPKTELKTEDDDFDDTVSVFSDSDFAWGSETKDGNGQIFLIKIDDKKENSTTTTNTDKTKSDLKTNTRAKITKAKKTRTNIKAKLTTEKPSKPWSYRLSDFDTDRRTNTLKLLENSNMCLFQSHRIKYGCHMCTKTFVDITALREHGTTHPRTKLITSKISQIRGLSFINVDITDLKCSKCDQSCADLTDLTDHLTLTHEIVFLNGGHFLIPYRLTELRCVLCGEQFNTFTRLSIHMNTHYTNNVCDICGLSYINRSSLRMHYLAIHKEKKCSLCGDVFTKSSTKKTHMKKVHNISIPPMRYCNLCDKTFQYSYLLNDHKIKEHNFQKPPLLHCPECDKTFLNKVNWRTHIRAVHIKERNHPCEVCGMRFFTKSDRVRHQRTHEDVKSFSCDYCDVKFKCKDSCRRHTKRQHGLQT